MDSSFTVRPVRCSDHEWVVEAVRLWGDTDYIVCRGRVIYAAVRHTAAEQGCRRLWVISTNDNLDALRFHQRRDFELVAVHRDLRTTAQRLKPSMPLVGQYGIPIRDEIELEIVLE